MENPIARNTDPATSHLAARRLTESGKRVTLTELAIALVEAFPGRTVGELYEVYCRDVLEPGLRSRFSCANALGKRISDAHNADMICARASRKCATTGEECRTWYRTERQWPAVKSNRNAHGVDVKKFQARIRELRRAIEVDTPDTIARRMVQIANDILAEGGSTTKFGMLTNPIAERLKLHANHDLFGGDGNE